MELKWFGLLLICSPGKHFSDAECSQNKNGFWFGQDCSYLCHCLDTNEQCDRTSGECSSGCDWKWGGPGCQYENLAIKELSRHLDNIPPPELYSDRANDEDLTTCSKTGLASVPRSREPWWKVWFPQNKTFRELSILTSNTSLEYFRSFKVTVEYVIESKNTDKNYYPSNLQTCFTYPDSAPTSTTISVICSRLLVGNQVRIQLGSTDTQLVLCDVRVFGDCPDNRCGLNCSQVCHCNNPTMEDKMSADCSSGCNGRWTGEGSRCDIECALDKWGNTCQNDCGNCYNNEPCVLSNGTCPNGCSAGYQPPDCTNDCADGRYGKDCTLNCSTNCLEDAVCNKTDGICPKGCKPGYKGITCDEECLLGTFGLNCQQNCSNNCNPRRECNKANGSCDKCQPGWEGQKCEEECDDDHYGDECNKTCGGCANDKACDKVNGTCEECGPGYIISAFCDIGCEDNRYGYNCSIECGNCKGGSSCDRQDGSCSLGCEDGYTGDNCMQELKMTPGPPPKVPTAGVVGGVAGGVVVVVIVSVVLFVRKRRQNRFRKEQQGHKNFDDVIKEEKETSDNKFENKTYVDRSKLYVNSSEVTAAISSKREKEGKAQRGSKSNQQDPSDGTEDMYYNAGPITKQTSDTAIDIRNFGAYVKRELQSRTPFEKEFKKIPYGLVHLTKAAKKPENAGKNRYKEMYAYDHSRVVLQTLPDDPDSDYINASYIKGHFKDRAYIAAQGPMPANVDEFWRMIWENDIRTIAMVTNTVEETKTKCIKYWKAVDSTAEYGPVQIYTEKEDNFAEYIVRRFKVSHKETPGKEKIVQHFQYIAWPDKSIPSSSSSLLHFWRKVRKVDAEKSHPWVIHCSAGVGRTGTFIALDILYDQGKELGYLDVFQCVKDLRDQRVNMVQTREQYKFLHSILVELFVLPSEPVGVEAFPALYQDLQELDQNKKKTKLLLEYESLHDESNNVPNSSPRDTIYSCAKQTENKSKNRYDNILAPNEYRPFLSTHVDGCTNYINAVFVPSYCDVNGYILTQTPMPHTVVDLCRLIHEQEVEIVVSFDNHKHEEVGVVFPEKGSVSIGPFTVQYMSKEQQPVLTRKIYSFSFQQKNRTISQLLFTQWPEESLVPRDSYGMFSFLQELETLQRQHDNKPIIIQCLNGAERSGLVVVLKNILERAIVDEEISIPQVIRQMRLRRQQIIPNYEQFRFCYEVFLCYAESSSAYANM